MLSDEVKQSARASVLCWLATTDADGAPNVSPKEMFLLYAEDKVLIANIASPSSVKNIRNNSAACLSFVDVFKQKGFKLKGGAKIAEKGSEEYALYLAEIHAHLGGEAFPVASIIELTVTRVEPIVAPSYRLFPDTLDEDRIASAMQAYGVRPA